MTAIEVPEAYAQVLTRARILYTLGYSRRLHEASDFTYNIMLAGIFWGYIIQLFRLHITGRGSI